MNDKELVRFMNKVNVIDDEDSCWEWNASIGSHGYGQIALNGRPYLAHRASYQHFVGDVPEGYDICHTCDNRKCVRPTHLFAGTRLDNVRDMYEKGRASIGEKHSKIMKKCASRGEKHSQIMKQVASRGENHYRWKGGG